MKARPRTLSPDKPARRPIFRGNFTNFLLLGFLAGLVTANFVPAVNLSLTATLAIAGLIASLLASQLSYYYRIERARKACRRAILTLEHRMERHIKAHGMHAHGPHSIEDGEKLPAQGSRALTGRR